MMAEDNLEIRVETPNDFPKVYNVNTEAFGRSDEAQLVDRLRGGSTFVDELSLVAALGKKIVGHILFTKIYIVDGTERNLSLALAPMAVLPQYQRQDIGGKLVREGLERAKALGYDSVIVLGHELFYPKFGFEPANKWNIKAPFNVPIHSFMGLELKNGAFDGVSGMVEYPTDFDV